jgi:hypothetical protein
MATRKAAPKKADAQKLINKATAKAEAPNLYTLFETDVKEGEAGKWLEVLPGISFKVRRFTSTASLNSRRRLLTALASKIPDDGVFADGLEDELMIEQMSEAIIADWKGITDRDGNVLECTIENKRKVLTDLPDIKTLIMDYAANIDNYRRASLEQVEKN